MSIQFAKAIVERIGAGSMVHVGASEDDALVRELALNGCRARRAEDAVGEAFDVIILDLAGVSPIAPILRVLSGFKSADTLVLRCLEVNRWEGDQVLFAAGWRRHPAGLLTHEYEGLNDTAYGIVNFYQRIPAAAAARWSVEDLQKDRGLHMDMLRESGSRADAHVVRYSLAAEYVRPGDRVLDCACGLGYGAAVLAALSRGADFLGMDLDPETAEYAQANYGGPGLRYAAGDVAVLEGVADSSIDLIVSMETLEHVPDWEGALAAFRRVLKPDGRVVCSVPDRWMDETGEDPNPHHLHVFDWDKLAQGLGQHFILESKYVQSAPGGFKLPESPRLLRQWPMEANDDTEWLLAVVSANPFAADEAQIAGFRHPQFAADGASLPTVVDFAGSYDNPYLYRTLIQMGERLRDDDKLFRLALMIAENARADSPDRGGAITVLGYRVLEGRSLDDVPNVIGLIESYEAAGDNGGDAHTARWRISHAFLAGKLMELTGDHAGAIAWYRKAAELDWRAFSPLLATKTVAASFFEGRLHLTAGDEGAARACFEAGVREALEAARAPTTEVIGDAASPLPFGLQELAEVIDMGSQCASALANLPLWRRSPGLFARQIDTRRFGLASWAKDLEQENRRLAGVGF
ncbi:MAG: class I SAM-dependent methyltransferase [Phenylobacterium sp.]|uniref:class I SAM-dependent methyltransferase n=1 Tax=Phenylobacterium sp. TaxID=1871053 RepID=UPI002734DB17|nr:class I SAM-dependent methyltransferase [Phenylobacterium sp.]MDP3174251.1 class I SAM-dependent methyltransferase [Phenylobacterium sp.]